MTETLRKAFAQASLLPEQEQDLIASRLLAELAAETEFDRAIAASPEKLTRLAAEALEELRNGRTSELRLDDE